jgi:biotin operon repressor
MIADTEENLGAEIGMCREDVSRAIGKLRRLGLISVKGHGHILVHDPDQLLLSRWDEFGEE